MGDKRCLKIARRLIERGMAVLYAPRGTNPFTRDEDADRILNNIESYPHAFVLGCIADRGMSSEKSWLAAYQWCRDITRGGRLTFQDIERGIRGRGRRHQVRGRYPGVMTRHFYSAIRGIDAWYEGNAAKIWCGSPIAAAVIGRFLRFDGMGPKIANMAAHILLRDFKVPLREKHTIDMPVDSNVVRVFEKLGLIPQDSPKNEDKKRELIVCKARELSPAYPAVFDTCVWQIGKKWCHGKKRGRAECSACCMRDLCPSAD